MTLCSPLPCSDYAAAWEILRQFSANNFDDDGPQTLDAFAAEMQARQQHGERTWGIYAQQQLLGLVGYAPVSSRTGMFHGICFDRAVHGSGVASRAVSGVLDELFASGVEKISAAYFADNQRVHRFLARLGAIEEGYLRRQTVRAGQACDMRLVAFFQKEL